MRKVRVLFKTRLIFPGINGPNIFIQESTLYSVGIGGNPVSLIMNTFLPALLWASCSISRLTEFSLSLHPLFWCHMVSLSYISDLTKPRRRRQRERQNTIILMSKTTTLHVHHAFLYISLPSLRNYDVKWPKFKFTWERKRQGDKFYHLCPNLSAFPSLHLQPLSDRKVPIKELWQRRRQRGH